MKEPLQTTLIQKDIFKPWEDIGCYQQCGISVQDRWPKVIQNQITEVKK